MSTATRKRTPVSFDATLDRIEQRHRALMHQLADTGIVLRGSIAARRTRCGQPKCRCKANPPTLHGPYYFWTRKVAGKTVNVVLSPAQAARCQQWSRNMRRADQILSRLQALGLRAAHAVRRRS